MMNENLKPCPFCGGMAILSQVTRKGHGGCDLFSWNVYCRECNVKTPIREDEAVRDDGGIRLVKDGRSDSISAWNRRTT